MAAGLTDHVWTLREVLLFRVPPWPQPQAREAAWQHDDRQGEGTRGAYGHGQWPEVGLVNPV